MAAIWSLRRVFRKNTTKPANVNAARSPAKIEIGDFVINMIERTATVQGENLRLTAEEFDVLVFLATHPQRCVTPRTVLATNWTDDDHHHTKFLQTLLSLRRKLEAVAGGKQYLRTEPWVIYRFEPRSSFAA
jgi:two-component system, OmpR family, KDP operon response regulator KdpE